MNKFLLGTALAVVMPVAAVAAPVNLTGWIENGLEGNNGAGTWTVGSGNDNVYQSTMVEFKETLDPALFAIGRDGQMPDQRAVDDLGRYVQIFGA